MQLKAREDTETPRKGRFFVAFALPLSMIGAAALVAGWLAPNHYPPWTSFHGEAAAFAALCAFWLAHLLRTSVLLPARPSLVTLILLPLVWLQWRLGQIPYGGDALLSGLYIAGFSLAWWLGANAKLERPQRALTWFAAIIIFAATASVLIAVLQWLRIESSVGIYAADRGPDMRAYGNLGQPNHLATLVLMGTALAGGLFLLGGLKGWHVALIGGWFAFGLILTESRSGLLAAIAMTALLLIKRHQAGRLGSWRLIAAWWMFLVGLVLAWQPLNEALYLQPPRVEGLVHSNGRGVMWLQSLAAIRESPWVGYGWRQSMAAQKMGAHFVDGWLATDYAHNIALDVLLWVGVPVGLGLIGTGVWWLARAAIRVRTRPQLVLFAAVIPLLIHSLFEFPFAYAYFLFPAAWLLGALSAQQITVTTAAKLAKPAKLRALAFASVAAFGGVSAAVGVEYLQLEEDYRVMRFELRRVGTRPLGHIAPEARLLTQLDELLKLGRMVPRAGMSATDIERLRVGSVSFGWATLHLSYAVALGLNGQAQQASAELKHLRAIYGKESYAQARRIFLELPRQHPELAAVEVP